MSKRQLVPAVIVLSMGVLAGAAWLEPTRTVRGLLRRESFYEGRSTSYWRAKLRDDDRTALQAGGVAAVPVLTEALQDDDPAVRQRAAELLGELGPQAKDAAPALLRTIADDEDTPDANTLAFLQKMAAIRAEHPKGKIEVQDADRAAQDAAAQALKKVDPQAAERAGLP